jgi:hypothetical protein
MGRESEELLEGEGRRGREGYLGIVCYAFGEEEGDDEGGVGFVPVL